MTFKYYFTAVISATLSGMVLGMIVKLLFPEIPEVLQLHIYWVVVFGVFSGFFLAKVNE